MARKVEFLNGLSELSEHSFNYGANTAIRNILAMAEMPGSDDIEKSGHDYEKKCDQVAKQIKKMAKENATLRNELCRQCGKYQQEHDGACDGCRWRRNDG